GGRPPQLCHAGCRHHGGTRGSRHGDHRDRAVSRGDAGQRPAARRPEEPHAAHGRLHARLDQDVRDPAQAAPDGRPAARGGSARRWAAGSRSRSIRHRKERGMKAGWLISALIAVLGARADAAIVAATGYAAHLIPTPGPGQGGVVRRNGAILVGQGSFGANGETVIRLDGGGPTTIATGFNSLGGFDLDATGTLFVADNGGELGGATTGDTLFSIPNALTRTSPV